MEFLLYLTPIGRDIYNLISQKVKVVENTPICRKHDIYGWYNSRQKLMIFCSDRIKKGPNPKFYFNETLYHESVHVAQVCKSKDQSLKPLGISPSMMPLTKNKMNDVEKSISISGSSLRHVEHEAYWMEDKPEKVRYVVRKYCF